MHKATGWPLCVAGLGALLSAASAHPARAAPAAAASETTADAEPGADAQSSPESGTTAEGGAPWSIALATGISDRDAGSDGSWQSIALSRQVGRGYVRGAMMRYHGTLLQADTALPSDYLVGTLGAGGNFANWVVDAWASYGRQDYGRISTALGKRESTGAAGSPYYAIGGDFGRVVPVGRNLYVTPTMTFSYAHGRLLHPAPEGSGVIDLETNEPTLSSAATLRIDHAFGSEGKQYAGLSLARAWTSNAVSEVAILRYEDVLKAAISGILPARHLDDGWWEVGATANMRITARLSLDLYASRSFDALAGNTTAAGISLRRSF